MTGKLRRILEVVLSLLLFVGEGRAVLDPQVLVSEVISSHIAIQNDHIIWSEFSTTPIRKMLKTGGPISNLAHSMGSVMSLMIHDGHFFWIESFEMRTFDAGVRDMWALNKTSLDGKTNTVLSLEPRANTADDTQILDMVIYRYHVYWVVCAVAESPPVVTYKISKVPINGGESITLVSTSKRITALMQDGSNLYWMEASDGWYFRGVIKKMSFEEAEPITVYSADQNILYGVMTVSGGEIVFGDIDPINSDYRLMKVSSSGGAATVLARFHSKPGTDPGPNDSPQRIIIDGNDVYWVDQHSLRTIPLDGGAPAVLADNLGSTKDVMVLNGTLFWTESKYWNGGQNANHGRNSHHFSR